MSQFSMFSRYTESRNECYGRQCCEFITFSCHKLLKSDQKTFLCESGEFCIPLCWLPQDVSPYSAQKAENTIYANLAIHNYTVTAVTLYNLPKINLQRYCATSLPFGAPKCIFTVSIGCSTGRVLISAKTDFCST